MVRIRSVLRVIGWVFVGIAGFAAISLIVGVVVMALWNHLMPAIFGLPALSYWQAVGLLILAHLLFCGHGPRGNGPPWRRRKDFRERLAARFHAHESDASASFGEESS